VCDAPEVVYTEFIDAILNDIHEVHILFNAVNGHGKSSSLRTIIYELKRREPDIILKIFDTSPAWFRCAPVKYRQRVTRESFPVVNVGDCVYEMGSRGMNRDLRRAFVATIIEMDYRERYDLAIEKGLDYVEKLPFIIYVFEEAKSYFDSWSLTSRKDDPWNQTLNDFVIIGRNYNMRAFFIVSAEDGEIAPPLRRRATRILGHIESKEDLSYYKGKSKWLAETVKTMPKFHWVYWNGKGFGPVRVRDLVKSAPVDYVPIVAEVAPVEQKRGVWWYLSRVAIVATAVFMFLKSVFNR